MAKYGSDQVAFVCIDGYQLAGCSDLVELSENYTALTEETTGLGCAAIAHEPVGLVDANLQMGGFYNDEVLKSAVALTSKEGIPRVVSYALEGNVASRKVVNFAGPLTGSFKRIAKRGELQKLSLNYKGGGLMEQGQLLATLTARTTADHTDLLDVDGAAASPNGGVAYLQVVALTLNGATNLMVHLHDSADAVTYGDVASGAFTAVTAAPAFQRLPIAAALKRYASIAWAWTGAGTPTATFMVALYRRP